MKNIKILIGLLVFLGFQSCSDYLTEVPDNRTQLNSPKKISELLINAYPSTDYMYFTELMTDNVGDSQRIDNTELDNTSYYKFEDFEREEWDSPSWYWSSAYDAIAHANQALEAIEDLGNPTSLNPQRGEALLARAYAHFMLLSIFSEAYDPATAESKLGIPYMKDVEVNLLVNYTRNTIAETMEFIEKDIEEGIALVGNTYAQPKFHFTQNSAKAFATKFYAYKGDWDKVLEYSNDLGDKPVGKLRNLNEYSILSFEAQMNKYASKEENTNLLIGAGPSIHGRNIRNKRFGLNREIAVSFISNNPFGKNFAYILLSTGNEVFYLPKFNEYFKYSNASAGIGQPVYTFVLLSNDDMYLHRIEAAVMKEEYERAAQMLAFFVMHKTTGATEADLPRLNDNYIMRMFSNASEYEPFYSLSPKQQSYIKAIAEFRRREFSWEGARFFDVKRYNLEVVHKLVVENEEVILEKKDPRKAIQLPKNVFSYGIEANPR